MTENLETHQPTRKPPAAAQCGALADRARGAQDDRIAQLPDDVVLDLIGPSWAALRDAQRLAYGPPVPPPEALASALAVLDWDRAPPCWWARAQAASAAGRP